MKKEKPFARILSNELGKERGESPLKRVEVVTSTQRYLKDELEGTHSSNQDTMTSPAKTSLSMQRLTPDQNSPRNPPQMQDVQEKLKFLELKLAQERLVTKPTLETEPFEMHLALQDDSNEDVALKWCPFCSRESVTFKKYKNTAKTFWASVAIFFTGGVLGCFLLPYASNNCKQPYQVCSKCDRSI